ncbi:NifB/NifX family molybdenum-iron cluster-binding protein [Endomicrobium proavitum]|uniref:Putative Dinitrogenase iron-molybdenum cofactor biosynthesis protein NifB n=1 Tax=Endomicrobium proavitum TaxID=1408281 RepID=A0A0G3WJM9_9BACT|nr:NifB/NifX family molybdenum-iron cluster-binding protein [Endomicrobium proavitum]AKL98067.1 putative Dinitrogenase iron-molybdenum cofactor biosynthesis protein NifB [Endomicrobium proavitum]
MALKKIAFASTDGVYVDEHFGRADMFYIYDILPKPSLTERRRFARSTERCHDESNFEKAYETLKDCEAVFASKVGQSAAEFLIKKNIRVFQVEEKIEDVLEAIIEENKNEQQ